MRGTDDKQGAMFSFLSPEKRVPKDHPLRAIKAQTEAALRALSPVFDQMYSATGRPSVAPERLLKATLLMALYSVRSERQFCEQLDYNLLFRWFLDMSMDEASFVPTVFTKNRERLLEHEVAPRFLAAVVGQARRDGLLSSEHFTVDGTLIEAWASLKSFRRQGDDDQTPPDDPGNPTVNFRGEQRRNDTHASTTDPAAKLARKGDGREAKLSYSAHALMENRHGLLVDFRVATATGTAERETAVAMLREVPRRRRATVGADKAYDTAGFVAACRELGVTPHVACNAGPHRRSRIDGRTHGQPGYAISQRKRKLVEEVFGWLKTVAGFRRTRYRGLQRTQLAGYLAAAAYNLVRMARLAPVPA